MESKGPRVFFVARVTGKKFPESTDGVLEVGVFFFIRWGRKKPGVLGSGEMMSVHCFTP